MKTLTHLHGDLANGPGSIVTHGDKLWVEVEPQDWHKLSWGKDMDMPSNHLRTHRLCDHRYQKH